MKYFARAELTGAALLVLGLCAPAAAEIEWREAYYNPRPAEGDLILPMPCGGAMAFRPVETPNSGGTVGDVRVTLGQEGDDQPYLNGLRRSYVSGAFDAPGGGGTPKGLFWLGKYEIAEAQWDAVMNEACPGDAPRKRGFVPAVEHSALDYAVFAERYTLWLLQNARDALPAAGETRAYLRLPTEDEWEFSARGGLAVEEAAFRAPRPPIGEGREPSEFIAHGGTDSAGGRVQVIGTLEPNPLGLHDMLGNAGEIVETPFALVRHGRLHGQAGGTVKRGGDARTPLDSITSALRYEVPPFDLQANAPSADRFTGARLAIAGLSITSAEQTARLIEDLDRIASAEDNLSSARTEAELDAVIDELAQGLDAPANRRRLELVRASVAAARAERNAARDRSLRLLVKNGTLICDQALQRMLSALALLSLMPSFDELEAEARASGDAALMAELEAARAETADELAQLEARKNLELVDFANLVEGLAADYSTDLLTRSADFVATEVDAKGERPARCLDTLEAALRQRATQGYVDGEALEAQLREIALDLGTQE
jgi:hypothetical protein